MKQIYECLVNEPNFLKLHDPRLSFTINRLQSLGIKLLTTKCSVVQGEALDDK
jgi:hypothetical protein